MKEAKHQIQWNKYLRTMREQGTPIYGAFELKQTRKDYISFDCLEEGQRTGLPAINTEGFIWKLSDADPRLKPCDCICTPPLKAYIVIKYPEFFAMIPIQRFFYAQKHSQDKSLTSFHAKAISDRIIYT